MWTYTNHDHPGLLDQRPVTVIADDEHHLAVWLAPGTRMLHQVLADGSGIRTVEGAARFTAPRAQGAKVWQGAGIVAVFQPGADYSVWFFETESGLRNSYYFNIEVPYTRTTSGIESADLILDVLVDADGAYRYKDEDELGFAQQAGLISEDQASRIRHAGDDAAEAIEAWRFPLDAGFETFQPDPKWPIPSLPPTTTWEHEG